MNESENTDENSVCILSRLSLLDLHECLAPSRTIHLYLFDEMILPNYSIM